MAERGLSVGIKAPPVGVGCRHTAPPDRGSPLDLHKRESQLCMLAPDGTATEHDSIALLWQLPAYVRQLLVRVLWATGRAAGFRGCGMGLWLGSTPLRRTRLAVR